LDINKNFAEYITDKFEILHIEDIYGNKIDKKIDKKFITYYLIKQIPIDIVLSTFVNYNNFINNGVIKNYYKNGILYEEYFHINGKKEGIYKLYYSNEQIKEEGTYINNLKEGEWILYHYDGKIDKKICYFNNNETNDK
jgi:antitoxin component YwqK of YwqJK toxin-antitoxin module